MRKRVEPVVVSADSVDQSLLAGAALEHGVAGTADRCARGERHGDRVAVATPLRHASSRSTPLASRLHGA